jgi:hypothetical protein
MRSSFRDFKLPKDAGRFFYFADIYIQML